MPEPIKIKVGRRSLTVTPKSASFFKNGRPARLSPDGRRLYYHKSLDKCHRLGAVLYALMKGHILYGLNLDSLSRDKIAETVAIRVSELLYDNPNFDLREL